MGAWGKGVFQSDGACDVMLDIVKMPPHEIVKYCERTFDEAVKVDFLEDVICDEVSVCGAIADSVLHGTVYEYTLDNSSNVNSEIQYSNWINGIKATYFADFERLKDKAKQALTILISEESELAELWADASEESLSEWKSTYEQIINRLN